ncbi:hypothetical protein FBY03_13524 [Pseudomonas sp. SJZ079]|uniref:hypothetical protein n=1 Tax=Pseudomonas sp. SJZ079 TaxID=2572887 RepID=UPI00119AF22B|nr:hypothetical protein [Pseudomonas sp. SJZ079]TWC28599.1 hypothetical protein FBY03_13524 [Pseudomonas sp. SJZ079]
MKHGLLCLLLLLSPLSGAAEQKVYLMATVTLGGSNLANTIFLHEPDITDLESCTQAWIRGQRDDDWLKYHHILRTDKMQGFTARIAYRCVTSELGIDSWHDSMHYDFAYLISVEQPSSALQVHKAASLAACSAQLAGQPAVQGVSRHCAKSNQRIDI